MKKLKDDFYLFVDLIKKNIFNYQNDLEIKLQYFEKLQNLCREEIIYVKNEFSLMKFLKLQMSKDSKNNLLKVLGEMKDYFNKIILGLKKYNQEFEKELLPLIKKENEIIRQEKNFIDETLNKIKITSERKKFQTKMLNREKMFKIYSLIDNNVTLELNYNREIASKCQDFINFIDYQINSIDTIYLSRRIKFKTRKNLGLINTSSLIKTPQENNVSIQKNKLTNILSEIDILSTRKNRNRKELKQKQNNRMDNIDRVVIEIQDLSKGLDESIVGNKERYEREKSYKINKIYQLQKIKENKKDSIRRMSKMNKNYDELLNPLNILVNKNILTKKKNKYLLNKQFLNKKNVKITKKMINKIKSINKNLNYKSIDSFYN